MSALIERIVINMKSDHQIIASIINKGAHVLDLGCGNGELLAFLMQQKKALVQGIELDENQMHQCVERGLTVLQGDIESGLVDYPDKSFDFVILNQIMQQIKKADFVIQESLRVGKRVIVGFPNLPTSRPVSLSSFAGRRRSMKPCPTTGLRRQTFAF